MAKVLVGFVAALLLVAVGAAQFAGDLMFREIESPFGVEETAARIQANIQSLADHGWRLSALRDPSKAVAAAGGNVPPVLLVEACSTKYSKPLLAQDATRILSLLMPCTISVYKKENGKVYIALMNAGLVGRLFGSDVGRIMSEVAADQKVFTTFDPTKPAPALIRLRPGGGGGSGPDAGGC